jgi:Zn finger protein HypA/HybF involved in hydrogenase expression
MHELSVIMAVTDTVDEYLNVTYDGIAAQSRVTRVTLQIGKRSSYIPSYISEIWPFAVKGTSLDGAALETEDIEGKDFLIKEIEVEE